MSQEIKQETKQEILNKSGLTVPLEMNSKALFEQCKAHGFSRYAVARKLLEVGSTTGRTISLGDDYIVKIDKELNVNIDKVTTIK